MKKLIHGVAPQKEAIPDQVNLKNKKDGFVVVEHKIL